MSSAIRIGRIGYTNVWPIFFRFPYERFEDEVEMIAAVPTSLNQAMRKGEIDMGPISAFAYGPSFDDYLLYPDLSVSAFGRVGSIHLFHEKPLEEIANGTIALTTASATSVNLLKIIMGKFYKGNPEYRPMEPNLQEMMKQADAALLIGDDAIRGAMNKSRYHITDLGELWKQHTGKWMTFAVWAVRRQTAERYPELTARIFDAFVYSKEMCLSDPEPMIQEAVTTIGGTSEYWRSYFAGLCYDFGPAQWEGLSLYYQYAWELGLLERPVPIRIWNDKSSCR